MKTKTIPWPWILFGPVILILVSKSFFPSLRTSESKLPIYGKVPDFTLTEKSGRSVTASELLGKVWIVQFMFTHCAGPCPLVSAQTHRLQEKIKSDRMRFVSFSVDPDHDTPEVLSQYADRFHADKNRWLFLTGDKGKIYELATHHFHLGVSDIPAEEREAMDQSVRHSMKLTLVDPSGRIRGYYDSDNPANIEQLAADAETLWITPHSQP